MVKIARKLKQIKKTKYSLKTFFNVFFKKPNEVIGGIIQKLNFFDYLVFVAIILILLLLTHNRLERETRWIDVRLSIEKPDWWYKGNLPAYWYGQNLQVGDIAYDSFGSKVAEIESVDSFDLGDKGRKIYINMKVQADFNKSKDQYIYEFKPLVSGSSIVVNFSKTQVKGLVVALENQLPIKYHHKTITIQSRWLTPEITNAVNVGDKIFDAVGGTVAEVLSTESTVALGYEFSDIRAKNLPAYNPMYRHLIATVRVKAFSVSDLEYYIDETPLKLGQKIDLYFPNLVLKEAEIIALD